MATGKRRPPRKGVRPLFSSSSRMLVASAIAFHADRWQGQSTVSLMAFMQGLFCFEYK